MESDKIRIENIRSNEEDREKASTAYVMSLVAMIIGLPMPIINLAATALFFFLSRKSSPFVRWHSRQALISQVPLFVMNNILFWWTVRILFCFQNLSSAYVAYFIVVNVYNVYDLISTILSAVRVRQGGLYRWHIYSDLTDMWTNHDASALRRVFTHSLLVIGVFFASLFCFNQVDWLGVFHVKETVVSDKLSEWGWQGVSALYDVLPFAAY